jgi:hypothetical protein
MKPIYLLALALLVIPQLALAAPDSYDGYCLVTTKNTKTGKQPVQGEVHLKKGESKELHVENGLTYTVKYSDDLGREGVLSLFIIDKAKHKYVGLMDLSIDQGTTFPGQVDLLTQGVGGISCLNWK